MRDQVKSSRITILGKVFPGLDVLSEEERDRVLGALDFPGKPIKIKRNFVPERE